MKKSTRVMLFLVIAISLVMIVFHNGNFTAYVTEGETPSNVTIAKSLAIELSSNLSGGIVFETVESLPATNINATQNYGGASSGTEYYINVSDDGNTNVDFCIKANADLTSPALDVIGLDNETYSNYTTTNSTHPLLADETPLNTTYEKSGVNVAVGGANYWRFWLDVPASQSSGTYNNTVSFKAVDSGINC